MDIEFELKDEEPEDLNILLDYYYRSLKLDTDIDIVFIHYVFTLLSDKISNDVQDAIIEGFIKNIRTNNEFYICPVYNELLARDQHISLYEINVDAKHMLGTPEELQIFIDKINNKEVVLND